MSCHDCEGGGTSVLLSFMLGGAVGSILGILYAPGSGEETRRKIKFYAEEAADKAVERMQQIRTEADGAVDRVKTELMNQKERVTSAIDAGKNAFREERGLYEEGANG